MSWNSFDSESASRSSVLESSFQPYGPPDTAPSTSEPLSNSSSVEDSLSCGFSPSTSLPQPTTDEDLAEAVPLVRAEARSPAWPTFRTEVHEPNPTPTTTDEINGSTNRAVFKPITPPHGYTPLTFRPKMLTRRVLFPIVALYTFALITLGFLIYLRCSRHVWTVHNVNYYLAACYLPAILGVFTTMAFSNTISTLRRMLPFIHMADQDHSNVTHKAAQGMCARYFPLSRSFLDWRIGLLNVSSFVVQFTIAAKATLFYVEETEHGAWLISVRLSSAVYLSLTYLVVTCVTVFVTFKYSGCNTGLKNDWDPTSLADLIQLLVINDTRPLLEHALDYSRWMIMVAASTVKHRIGYWEMFLPGQRKPTIVHGIHSDGSDNTIPCPGHEQRFRGFLEPHGSPDLIQLNGFSDTTSTMQPESIRCANECKDYPYKKGPFVDELSFSHIYILSLFAYVACLAWILIRIWFYDGIVLQTVTWLIQSNNIAIAPNSTEFVSPGSTVVQIHNMFIHDQAADFRDLLAFILLRLGPINTMSLIGRSIKVLDTHHRWTQPFTDMYNGPASVSSVLSQDYMTVSPLSVISQAWENGHHKVVFFGVLSALDCVPALIITGLCAITETGSGVIVRISPTAACLGILWSIVYIYALSSAWPAQQRKLPRDVGSLYDLLCLFHDSELRWLPQFMRAATSKNMTKRWLHSSLVTSSHKVSFGVMGAPDNQHCGFDLAQHVRRVISNPDLRDRAGEALGLSTRSRQSSPAADEEASIELDDVGGASAVRHRRVQSDEATPPVEYGVRLKMY